VTRLILAHFFEVHPLALEHAMILTRQRFAYEPLRAQLNLPDFLENFAGDHASAGRGTRNAVVKMVIGPAGTAERLEGRDFPRSPSAKKGACRSGKVRIICSVSWHRQLIKNLLNHRLARLVLGFGFVRDGDAMS